MRGLRRSLFPHPSHMSFLEDQSFAGVAGYILRIWRFAALNSTGCDAFVVGVPCVYKFLEALVEDFY